MKISYVTHAKPVGWTGLALRRQEISWHSVRLGMQSLW